MNREFNISGIQQIGVGVESIDKAWPWYAKHFGMDLPIFQDEAEARLMTQYTGGKVHRRKAVLAMNLRGGGGFELWQFTSRKPKAADFEVKEGLSGISSVHLRSADIDQSYQYFEQLPDVKIGYLKNDEIGRKYFLLEDPFRNHFKIVSDQYCFIKTKNIIGGVIGATIGVDKPDEALSFYSKVLGFSKVVASESGNGTQRWWIQQDVVKKSAFGDLLGPITIEIVYNKELSSRHVYNKRFWGDPGFIHLCLDIQSMKGLRKTAIDHGHPFTVDSESSYDMGEAAGQFAYLEDPDKTLIELVETHKVPVFKKLNWYIKLNERSKFKTLPKFIFRLLALNRVKF